MHKENLPKGWEITNVEKVFFQISTQGKSIKIKNSSQEGKYPVIDQGEEYISGYCDDENKVISIENSVVVFGDHTRNIKWIDFDFIAGADGIKIFLPKKEIYSRFFYYQLRSFELPNKGYHRHFRYLKEKSFLIPSLSEQTQIATLLDDLLARVQAIQTRLNKIPELLKQFRQSVLADAVSGRLTEKWREENNVEFDWESNNLKSVTFKIGSGSTPKGGNDVYKGSGIPFVRSLNIYTHFIKYDELAYIDENQAEKLKNVEIKKNDILLNITGASIGRVNIAPKLFIGGRVNQHVSIIRPKLEKLLSEYLHIFLSSPKIQKWIEGENYGSTRQALTKLMLENLNIEIPTLIEQTQIVSMVENYLTLADTIETQTQQALEKVNLLTQSILAKAFRGELTEKWRAENQALISGENSAKALLAKIEAELQAVKKRK